MNIASEKPIEHVDVLIIGAGISGIGAACHLTMKSPDRSYAILEGRDAIGGTWDLFKYPGIRSDSDLYTFGYNFRPWIEDNPLAAGDVICNYLKDTTEEYGVDKKIRFGHHINKASWSTENRCWTLDITRKDSGENFQMTCKFLFSCTGYYNYDKGYLPEFKDYDSFKGTVAHPQHWPEGLDYTDKKVLVIGSGATAVTIVPAMAGTAAHVTMLQRSPSYVLSRPGIDKFAAWLNRWLPSKLAYGINRIKYVWLALYLYAVSRNKPQKMRDFIMEETQKSVGPDIDVNVHFNPTYKPWDQRLCLVPDEDLFLHLRDGSASVVTDHIDCFTEKGVKLVSGNEIEADIIVPATGLALQFMGGVDLWVDGKKIEGGDLINYKGMMFSNVPNMVSTFGYTNASWTLKADLTADYIARLLNHMKKHNFDVVVPELDNNSIGEIPMVELESGYVQRGMAIMPKQGPERPWRNKPNYLLDLMAIKFTSFNDGVLKFSEKAATTKEKAA